MIGILDGTYQSFASCILSVLRNVASNTYTVGAGIFLLWSLNEAWKARQRYKAAMAELEKAREDGGVQQVAEKCGGLIYET